MGVCSDTAHGFVVPYVLIVIGVLAMVTFFAMDRLSRNTEAISELEQRFEAETHLASARAEATYSILTSSQMPEGLDASGRLSDEERLMSGQAGPASIDASQIWVPDGAWRQVETGFVSARDASGLLPLNTARPESVSAVLQSLDIPAAEARNAAATLADCIDNDDERRFGGAEKAQYARAELPPPTNRPLRNFDELFAVMGWPDILAQIGPDRFAGLVTLSPVSIGLQSRYVPEDLKVMLRLGTEDAVIVRQDEFVSDRGARATPSNITRLLIVTTGERPRFELVELERRNGALEKPFTLRRIATRALQPDELSRYQQLWTPPQRLPHAASADTNP